MSGVDAVEAEVRELVRRRGIDPVTDRSAVRRLVDEVVADYDERALTSALPPLGDPRAAARSVYDAVAGFGPLQRHLDDPTVEEIWTNVTAQFENAMDTMETREMLLREDFANVHVSAQKAGICCGPLRPQVYNPVRYAALNHPGDDYANDTISQVAVALQAHGGSDPMAGLKVRTVLAAGQSQSAQAGRHIDGPRR